MLSFLYRWDYCWKFEFDINVKIENYGHHDKEQLLFHKKVHIKTQSQKKDVGVVFILLQETKNSNLFDKNCTHRAIGSFFVVVVVVVGEGGVRVGKNVGHHGWLTTKKNTGKNALKQSHKKWNLDQNINDSKSHIWIFFFWKYYFGRTALVHTFQ